MKYYLSIDGREYGNVSSIEITAGYRTESVKYALSGDMLIDRVGSEKIKLTAKINMLTDEDMTALRRAKDKIFCNIEFDRGNSRITRSMHISDFPEPAPLYFYGDIENGFIYGSVTITAEEK